MCRADVLSVVASRSCAGITVRWAISVSALTSAARRSSYGAVLCPSRVLTDDKIERGAVLSRGFLG
jgi:hypothetical protein